MPAVVEKWADEVRAGDVRALSRAITAIENHDANAEPLLRALFPDTGKAYLVGVTGAPGTGKSTLVDRLAAHYRKQEEAVGVIRRGSYQSLFRRRDIGRPHTHAGPRQRRGHVHTLHGHTRISGRLVAQHF